MDQGVGGGPCQGLSSRPQSLQEEQTLAEEAEVKLQGRETDEDQLMISH